MAVVQGEGEEVSGDNLEGIDVARQWLVFYTQYSYIFMEYCMIIHYIYTMNNDQIRVTHISVSSNIYYFYILGNLGFSSYLKIVADSIYSEIIYWNYFLLYNCIH